MNIGLHRNYEKSASTFLDHMINAVKNKKLHYCGEHSTSDFFTSRKLIYHFLLVINTNLHPILHCFQVMADYWSNFR